MKVVGYGWIKSGETLETAMERYGVVAEGVKSEKELVQTSKDAIKDFKKAVDNKTHRKSAKPRVFRIVLQEVE